MWPSNLHRKHLIAYRLLTHNIPQHTHPHCSAASHLLMLHRHFKQNFSTA
jgi:hypothetical protein